MKRTFLISLLLICAFSIKAQSNKGDKLQALEQNKPANQNITITATLKNSSRLFASKDDLTSVILIIPADSTVTVLDADSTYLHVVFEENEGFILNRHVELNRVSADARQNIQSKPAIQESQPVQERYGKE